MLMYPKVVALPHCQQVAEDDCLVAALHNLYMAEGRTCPNRITLRELSASIQSRQVPTLHKLRVVLESKLKAARMSASLHVPLIMVARDGTMTPAAAGHRGAMPSLHVPGTYVAMCQSKDERKHAVVLHIRPQGVGVLYDGAMPCALPLLSAHLPWVKFWCKIQRVYFR